MLPNKEPILKIGIFLPVDNRKKVHISFTDPNLYEIETDKQLDPACKTPERLNVAVGDVEMIITKIVDDDKHGITIHDVPAGRGFHWEQAIDVTLPGNIKITSHNGNLLITNIIPLEQYLACVAVSEMSPKCPDQFLQVQAITARSWILAAAEKKHSGLGIDACNDDCCQRYQGMDQMTSESKAVCNSTSGKVLLYNDEICDARYSKSCGGLTENAENIWDMDFKPYLTSIYDSPEKKIQVDWQHWYRAAPDVFCSPSYVDESELHKYLGNVDKNSKYFRWAVKYSQKELCELLSKKINVDIGRIVKIDALNRGYSGRINHLYCEYINLAGETKVLELNNEYDIRKTLHPSFLYSSCFMVKMNDELIEFFGAGWGHGVGLCQIGALSMALNGHSTEQILTHYYSGAKLKQLY